MTFVVFWQGNKKLKRQNTKNCHLLDSSVVFAKKKRNIFSHYFRLGRKIRKNLLFLLISNLSDHLLNQYIFCNSISFHDKVGRKIFLGENILRKTKNVEKQSFAKVKFSQCTGLSGSHKLSAYFLNFIICHLFSLSKTYLWPGFHGWAASGDLFGLQCTLFSGFTASYTNLRIFSQDF